MKASASTREWTAKFLLLSAVVVLLLLGAGYAILRVCFPAYIMSSGAMEPTLVRGDIVLVNRLGGFLGRSPHRGELATYHQPLDRKEVFLHRIVGVPGDRLKIRDRKLYRNGAEVKEPYIQHISTAADSYRDNIPSAPNFPVSKPALDMLEHHVVNGEIVVPAGHYFVMGDNRDDAFDSRYTGFIPAGDLVGCPFMILQSTDPRRNGKRIQ